MGGLLSTAFDFVCSKALGLTFINEIGSFAGDWRRELAAEAKIYRFFYELVILAAFWDINRTDT